MDGLKWMHVPVCVSTVSHHGQFILGQLLMACWLQPADVKADGLYEYSVILLPSLSGTLCLKRVNGSYLLQVQGDGSSRPYDQQCDSSVPVLVLLLVLVHTASSRRNSGLALYGNNPLV